MTPAEMREMAAKAQRDDEIVDAMAIAMCCGKSCEPEDLGIRDRSPCQRGAYRTYAQVSLAVARPLIERAIPIPDPTAIEEALAKAREGLSAMIAEWDKLTRYGSPIAKSANENLRLAREALAAIDAAKAKGGADELPAEKWDARKAPCPTCGFRIQTIESPPFEHGD